jgi:hypothetical protein
MTVEEDGTFYAIIGTSDGSPTTISNNTVDQTKLLDDDLIIHSQKSDETKAPYSPSESPPGKQPLSRFLSSCCCSLPVAALSSANLIPSSLSPSPSENCTNVTVLPLGTVTQLLQECCTSEF